MSKALEAYKIIEEQIEEIKKVRKMI